MLKIVKKQLTIKQGFTMPEIIVSIALFSIAILLVGSMYILAQRSYRKSADQGELLQNIRVSFDRMSREIRQSINIITSLLETNDDPLNPPSEEIFVQDGHDTSRITYLRYYLNNTDLKRSHLAYEFEEEPGTYVLYNSVDQHGDPPDEKELEDRVVGEYFGELQFWGSDGLVNISFSLEKNQSQLTLNTSAFCRN